ncbi:hypothetical protein ACWD62_04310 [Streptomyces sp. NPDC005146]
MLRERADSWQHNGEMEKAAELAAKGEQMSPSARMALGYYSDGKKAAVAAGRDTSDPASSSEGADRLAAAYDAISRPDANVYGYTL